MLCSFLPKAPKAEDCDKPAAKVTKKAAKKKYKKTVSGKKLVKR